MREEEITVTLARETSVFFRVGETEAWSRRRFAQSYRLRSKAL